MTAAEERVARGVALLDEKVPDWHNRIDLGVLDITNPWTCILGQVFGGYCKGLQELGLDYGCDYGFVGRTHYAIWVMLIGGRQNRGN